MDVLDELERRFAAAIEAEQKEAAVAEGRRRHGRRRLPSLPLATGAALAALAAVAAVVLVVAGGGVEDGTRRPASPSALLEQVARAAEQAPPPPLLRDGEQWYVRGEATDQWAVPGRRIPGTRGVELFGVRRRNTVEQWSGVGGPGTQGRIRTLTLDAAPMFASDRALWEAVPPSRRPFPPDRDVVFSLVRGLPLRTQLFTPRELRALPSEPDALLQAIAAAIRLRSPQTALLADSFATAQFEAIRDLLLLPVSPQQRAGLLRAFMRLPGTRVARIGSDARGRRGLLLVYTPRPSPRVPRVLVVGVEDGRLLAVRGPRNSVETTYVAQGVARDVLALPRGVAAPKARLPRARRADAPTTIRVDP